MSYPLSENRSFHEVDIHFMKYIHLEKSTFLNTIQKIVRRFYEADKINTMHIV
jgi:hypothetical protein